MRIELSLFPRQNAKSTFVIGWYGATCFRPQQYSKRPAAAALLILFDKFENAIGGRDLSTTRLRDRQTGRHISIISTALQYLQDLHTFWVDDMLLVLPISETQYHIRKVQI